MKTKSEFLNFTELNMLLLTAVIMTKPQLNLICSRQKQFSVLSLILLQCGPDCHGDEQKGCQREGELHCQLESISLIIFFLISME